MAKSELDFSAEVKRLDQAYRKAAAQHDKYTRKLERSNLKLREQAQHNKRTMEDANEKSFGSMAVSKVTGYAASFASVGAAVAGVTKFLETMNQEIQRGVQGMRELEKPAARLAQIADATAPMSQQKAELNRLRAVGGMGATEAGELQFTLRSAGLSSHGDMFARLHGIADPTAIATGVAALQQHFSGQATPRAFAGMLFRGAKESPRIGAEQLAPAVAQFAGAGSLIGASPSELVAAIGATESLAGSPEEAATMLKSFGVAASKNFPELTGGGFLSTARGIQGLGLSQQQLAQKLPRQALFGFQNLTKREGQITALTTEVERVRRGSVDTIGGILSRAEGDPQVSWQRRRRRAEQMATIGAEQSPEALAEEVANTRRDEVMAFARHRGASSFEVAALDWGMWALQVAMPKTWEPWAMGANENWRTRAMGREVRDGVREGMRGNTLGAGSQPGDRTENF